MKIAYFDCLSGASGDMILAALLDAGLSEVTLRERLAGLHLGTVELVIQPVLKNGFKATRVQVMTNLRSPERKLGEINALIQSSDLDPTIRDRALQIFARLAGVEARIHGKSPTELHLHELSGDDTIVDVVGTLFGMQELGIEQIVVSPLPVGRGFVDSAHGKIPLPAPATLELLKGAPLTGSPLDVELVTPTAAVLFAELAHSFGAIPPMLLESVGYGAGAMDLPAPNLLRVLIGNSSDHVGYADLQTLVLLETNLDDFNPQFYEPVVNHLFEAGAADVFLSSILMKKNRPAILLSVLCQPHLMTKMEEILFAETSTLGVRRQLIERHALQRTIREVQTSWGTVRLKIARLGDSSIKAAPEFDDCRALAELNQIPVKDVYLEAQLQFQRGLGETGRDSTQPGDTNEFA